MQTRTAAPRVASSLGTVGLEKPHRSIESPQAATQNELTLLASWQLAVAGIYVAGAAYFLARLLIALASARKLVRAARRVSLPPVQTQFVGATTILESSAVRVPITVGWRRPCILLPGDWPAWSDSLLQSVLAHEQTHVARRDQWVALLAACNRALYWFHPLAWFLSHCLSALAEEACDDAVIATTGQRTQYARHLLEVAGRLAGQRGRLEPAGVAMARIPRVERRINAILDARRPLARRLSLQGALVLVAIAVPVVLVSASLQADEDKPVAAETPDRTTSEHHTPTENVKIFDRRRDDFRPDFHATERPIEDAAKYLKQRSADGDSKQAANASNVPAAKQLHGRVVMQSDGQPVAKAEVRLITRRDNNARYATRTVSTNDRGEFVFSNVAEGNHQLAAFRGDSPRETPVTRGSRSIFLPRSPSRWLS
jgi:beta-lactamase regulating signal transducer with metallopeptidase domain